MPVLEITLRHTKLLILVFSLTSIHAQAKASCSDANISNLELTICSQQAFDRIDRELNESYKATLKNLNEAHKSALRKNQITWIKFKEEYCTEAYESVYPGKEAVLDRLSCLTQITSNRNSELIYLRTGVISDGFPKAVSIINQNLPNHDYSKAITVVAGSGDYGSTWRDYASENCALAQRLFGEDIQTCTARMRFQIPIN